MMYKEQQEPENMYDTQEYIKTEVAKMGHNPFAYYQAVYKSQDSCKEYLPISEEEYSNCMVEKANCAYEETIRLFRKLDKDKKQSELEQKLSD